MKNLTKITLIILLNNYAFGIDCKSAKKDYSICSHSVAGNSMSAQFEASESLKEKIVLNGVENDLSEIEPNIQNLKCTKDKEVRTVSCLKKSNFKSKKKVSQNFVEDLF